MIDWDAVHERMQPAFTRIISLAVSRYPDIKAGMAPLGKSLGGVSIYASFMYEPSVQEFEDLLLYLQCTRVQNFFREEDGSPFFRETPDRFGLRFVIERGTGELLAGLDPILLPPDEDNAGCTEFVHRYVGDAIEFLEANTDLVLSALAVPYQA